MHLNARRKMYQACWDLCCSNGLFTFYYVCVCVCCDFSIVRISLFYFVFTSIQWNAQSHEKPWSISCIQSYHTVYVRRENTKLLILFHRSKWPFQCDLYCGGFILIQILSAQLNIVFFLLLFFAQHCCNFNSTHNSL